MRPCWALLLALLLLGGCGTLPRPAESAYLRTEHAGFRWDYRPGSSMNRQDSIGRAELTLALTEGAPRPLYVEAILPSPDGSAGDRMRKTVSSGESRVHFLGPLQVGWRVNHRYSFRVVAYEDPEYLRPIDSLEQQSLCTMPPAEFRRSPIGN